MGWNAMGQVWTETCPQMAKFCRPRDLQKWCISVRSQTLREIHVSNQFSVDLQ